MTDTIKIKSQILRNEVTNFAGGQIRFDDKGQADVNVEDATNLLTVPDFTLVNQGDAEIIKEKDKQEELRKQPLSMYGKTVIVQLKEGSEEFKNLSGQLNTIGDSQYKFDADGMAMMATSAAEILLSVFPDITIRSIDGIEPEVKEKTVKEKVKEVVVDEPASPTESYDDETGEDVSDSDEDVSDEDETIDDSQVEDEIDETVKTPKKKGGRPKSK